MTGCVADERLTPGEHFVHDYAEAKDIAPRVYIAAAGLFRRHVGYRAHYRTGCGQLLSSCGLFRTGGSSSRLGELCKAEIEHLYITVRAQHHIFGLDIAMDDAGPVRCVESLGDLDHGLEYLVERHRGGERDVFAQRHTFDQLGGNVVLPVYFTDLVYGQNIRMIERRRRLRLLDETLQFIWNVANFLI